MTAAGRHIPFVADAPYPPRGGNRLRPLVGASAAFARIDAAVKAAKASVWVTVAFYDEAFSLTGDGEALLDTLERAAARGLDIRLLCWRPNAQSAGYGRTLAGTAAERAALERRGARFLIRWDRAAGPYCQHQKAWLIDAGQAGETAFVGSANLTAKSFGHHDVFLELRGPCATDVQHNFVQRWNEASERMLSDGSWGAGAQAAMAFPNRPSPACGPAVAQAQRTLHPGLYADGTASPGGIPQPVAAGEWTVLAQYKLAIDAARAAIHIENQSIPVPEVAERLEAALTRGVEVVLLVPAEPEAWMRASRQDPERRPHFEALARLGRFPNFTLAGLAGKEGTGSTYVHAKAMLVDDAWGTIGSCNLHPFSLYGHGELNVSFSDPEMVRGLRTDLLLRHCGLDTAALDACEGLRLLARLAQANAEARARGEALAPFAAFALDAERYAT